MPVRHTGFSLSGGSSGALEFSQFETLANRLATALEGHGLHIAPSKLQKNEADEVDIRRRNSPIV